MNFKPLLQKIESSEAFKNFKTQYPEAELCAGFFIIDYMANDSKQTLDYKINNKVFTLSLDNNEEIVIQEDKLIDIPGRPKLSKINNPEEINTDLDELKGIVGTKALDQGISNKFHKIIAVLQSNPNNQEEKIWNLTCMLEGLAILHVIINPTSGEITKFEKKSMMDMIKRK
jgi:hypothetical protein|tara:strand:+ start:429 stop:944 length:516 start_codon:yes stop_codon:yes gene_type:complete